MAQQEIEFNLNKFSYEGAGKMWEALASNAQQGAEVAGQEKNKHLGQSETGARLATAFRESAAATKNEANRIMSTANDKLSASGTAMRQMEIADKQMKAKSLLQVTNAMGKLGEYMLKADTTAKVTQGMIDGIKRAEEIDRLTEENSLEAQAQVSTFMEAYYENPSDPYLRGVAQAVLPRYKTTSAQVEMDRKESLYQQLGTLLLDDKFSYGIQELKDFASVNKLPLGDVKNVAYTQHANFYVQRMGKTQTLQGLTDIKAEWDAIATKKYKNKFYLDSANINTKKVMAATATAFTDAERTARDNIKLKAKEGFTSIVNSPDITKVDPVAVMGIINNISEDPFMIDGLTTKYKKALVEQDQVDRFVKKNPRMGQKTNWHPGEPYSPRLKKQIQAKVTNELMSSFFAEGATSIEDIKKSFKNFENVLIFKSEFAKEAGDYLFDTFMSSTSEEEMGGLAQRFSRAADTPSEWHALSQAMGADNLAKVLTISGMARNVFNGDFQAAKLAVSKAEAAGVVIKGDIDFKYDILEKGLTLGPDSAKYSRYVNILMAGDPNITAKTLEPKVFKMLEDSQKEISNPGWFNGSKVTVYTSEAPDFIAGMTEDPNAGYDAALAVAKRNMKEGANPTRMYMLPGGVVRVADPITNEIFDIDADMLAHQTNKQSRIEASLRSNISVFNKGVNIPKGISDVAKGALYADWIVKNKVSYQEEDEDGKIVNKPITKQQAIVLYGKEQGWGDIEYHQAFRAKKLVEAIQATDADDLLAELAKHKGKKRTYQGGSE